METINKKMKYVAPALEVVHIEMEEGIAGTSSVDAGGAPTTNGWTQGQGDTNNGEAW